jgi:hypothetical protein
LRRKKKASTISRTTKPVPEANVSNVALLPLHYMRIILAFYNSKNDNERMG